MNIRGVADLPLHYGNVPRWLFKRMTELASEILTIMGEEFGELKILERLSNPLWFQALSNVLGFDWHSSGSTTVLCGVLREAVHKTDLKMAVVGGKGRQSLRTPIEIRSVAERFRLGEDEAERLVKISRLAAKIDNAAIQDGFQIYHHTMIITGNGDWCIIQQGMNREIRMARRYHWLSEKIGRLVVEPHSAISSTVKMRNILNLAAEESENARKMIVEIVNENPEKIRRDIYRLRRILSGDRSILDWLIPKPVNIKFDLTYYRPLEEHKINWRRLHRNLSFNADCFENLLLRRGVGPSTLRALSLISELIYGEPPSKRDPVTHIYDPVKWSFTVGGKDGIPYPISKRHYDNVIYELELIIDGIRRNEEAKRRAFKNLGLLSKKWNSIFEENRTFLDRFD